MSERLSTAALACGALLLFYVLMFGGRGGGGAAGEPSRPTSIEAAGNGYSLARRWLESQGVKVLSLRERFDALARIAPPGPGRESLLVLTLPGAGPIQTRELMPLDRWLREGNTLLVVAALSDAPDWARRAAGADAFDLKAVTGLEFETVPRRDRRLALERAAPDDAGGEAGAATDAPADVARDGRRRMATPRRESATVVGAMPLLAGVSTLAAESDFPRIPWAVRLPYDGMVLELARDEHSGEGVLWSRGFGRGRIIISAYGTLLTNRALGAGDNGRLLANLVAAAVGPDGVVLFDDGHQGLAPVYDPDQLFGDRRLYVTVAVLLALWLLWVLGATRLRTPRNSEPAPRPGELLRAAGGFFARVLPADAAARRLCEHFFARLPPQRGAVPGAAPPWDWLERHPAVDPADLRRLREWHSAALAGQPVPLGNLHNLLCRIERRMR